MRRSPLACVLLGLGLSAAQAAAAEQRYQLLIAGKPAGEEVVRETDDGVLEVDYHFNDRGRGPTLKARYQRAADGTLTAMQIEGLTYMKSPVTETFEFSEGEARWQNASEQGTAQPAGPAFYAALEATPTEQVLLAQALLRQASRELALLPSGKARIERLAERRFGGQRVHLYALHGLSMTPEWLWLDEQQQFYAAASEWFSLLSAPARTHVDALLQAQREIEAEQSLAQAQALTRTQDGALLLHNVRAYDPARSRFVGNSVRIKEGRIVALGDDLEVRTGDTVLDGEGRFLMPGLWDMHVHLAGPVDGLLHLAYGVTSVRDLANDMDLLQRRSAAFEDGTDIGPRIYKAGFLDGSGPFAGPSKALADDAESVRGWIDRYADAGYVQLKLYSSLKRELVAEAITYAHERGLRVSGHVPMGLTAREFVELGADELQHANFLFLNFLAGKQDDTRTPLRFSLVAERGAQLDLSSTPLNDFIALLRARGTVVDPTLVAFEGLFLDLPKMPAPTYAAVLHRLPISWQRGIRAGGGGLKASDGGAVLRNRLAFDRMVALVGDLHRQGVTIVAGTDAAAGLSYARELELYVQAGIPPQEVLRIATVNAATAMGVADHTSHLAEGYTADLILVDGDPSRHIGDLRRVHTVIRGDRLYRAAELAKAAGLGE